MISLELLAATSIAMGAVAIVISVYLYLKIASKYETLKESLDGYSDIIARRIYEQEINKAKTSSVTSTPPAAESTVQKPVKLTSTEIEIIKLCESPTTAKEIQQRLGLTREHITRELKKLYEMGLIERASQDKPFKYILTEKGKGAIEGAG